MNDLHIYCADVGSIKQNKFGWACSFSDDQIKSGNSIEDFSNEILKSINTGFKVAIGFECPLFVPMNDSPKAVNSARLGEGNRSWSASAGSSAMATGLVEVLWVLQKLSDCLSEVPVATFSWSDFEQKNRIFLWEAFVTSSAKGNSHSDDAEIAVKFFRSCLPASPWNFNAIESEKCFSLVGAAAVRTGVSVDFELLSQPCVVLKP